MHLFNGLFSRTTWVSWHQKNYVNLDFSEARDDGVAVASAGPYKIICTSLQTDNHTSTSSLNFFTGRMLFLTPNQQCQSTEGNYHVYKNVHNGLISNKHLKAGDTRQPTTVY